MGGGVEKVWGLGGVWSSVWWWCRYLGSVGLGHMGYRQSRGEGVQWVCMSWWGGGSRGI